MLVPVHVRRDDLVNVVRGLQCVGNLDGLFVTVPHKVAAAQLADRRSRTVEISGSANALRREPDGAWLAANFDGSGFVAGLVGAGHSPRGRLAEDWPGRVRAASEQPLHDSDIATPLRSGCAQTTRSRSRPMLCLPAAWWRTSS
ncbi:hypothetical protein ACIA6D_45690 [Streptomyces cacaoi]